MSRERGERAMACVGAVVGAGFASGREIMTFYTQYGDWAWGLMVLTVLFITGLSALVMKKARSRQGWCALLEQDRRWYQIAAKGALLLLYAVTGGAMFSAAAELAALLLPWPNAYWIGLLLTLILGAWLARRRLRFLAVTSAGLTALLLLSYVLLLRTVPTDIGAVTPPRDLGSLPRAILFALAYGSLNVTIGLEVICECTERRGRGICRVASAFGLTLLLLMFLANALYLRQPMLQAASMPLVALLNRLGPVGYRLGAMTLFLAVLTTLVCILRALYMLFEPIKIRWLCRTAPLAIPLALSFVGFAGIVERWYAPVGLCCLLLLLLPMLTRRDHPLRRSTSCG